MNITKPKIGDKVLFDNRHVVHVVAVDSRNVAFERRDKRRYRDAKTGIVAYPIQIVNLWTWQARSCATLTQSQQKAVKSTSGSTKSRRAARLPNRGGALKMQP